MPKVSSFFFVFGGSKLRWLKKYRATFTDYMVTRWGSLKGRMWFCKKWFVFLRGRLSFTRKLIKLQLVSKNNIYETTLSLTILPAREGN